jgi:hypothetical protein
MDTLGQPKDIWDKISASSAIFTFISSVLIAAVGGYFTYSYNQRQIELNKAQADRDAGAKLQSNKVLELEAINKIIPTLSSKDEAAKTAALITIQHLADADLASDLARSYKGKGAIQYLQQAASSTNPKTREVAAQALSSIASADQVSTNATLDSVLNASGRSVVLVRVLTKNGERRCSGVNIGDGHILTTTLVVQPEPVVLRVQRNDRIDAQAHLITSDTSLGLAILSVEGFEENSAAFVPAHFKTEPPTVASRLFVGGYDSGPHTGEESQRDSPVMVYSVGEQDIELSGSPALVSRVGGPLLDASGNVLGILRSAAPQNMKAIRGDVVVAYIRRQGLAPF